VICILYFLIFFFFFTFVFCDTLPPKGILEHFGIKQSRARHVTSLPSKITEKMDGGFNLQTSSRLGGSNVTF
jgi:hypothetical protein